MKLAFVGYAGSGKDYFADWLVDNKNFTKIAFADEIKKYTHELFPHIKEFYSHNEKDKKLDCGLTPREIWINLSNPILEIDSEFFLKRTKSQLKNLSKHVVTDVRRRIEFDYLMSKGYTIVYIHNVNVMCNNSFDEKIAKFVNEIEHTFVNNFNGIEEFKNFIQYLSID